MTVYFIDEDFPKLDAWLVELSIRGLDVKPIGDADRARVALLGADDIRLAIVDVMLSASEETTDYDQRRTDGSLITGLVLLEDLCHLRPDVFPSRAVLLTNATDNTTLGRAMSFARDHGIELMRKMEFDSTREFGDRIVALIERNAGDGQ